MPWGSAREDWECGSTSLGVPGEVVQKGTEIAVPLLTGGLARVADTSEGQVAIANAVKNADSGVLGNLSGFEGLDTNGLVKKLKQEAPNFDRQKSDGAVLVDTSPKPSGLPAPLSPPHQAHAAHPQVGIQGRAHCTTPAQQLYRGGT